MKDNNLKIVLEALAEKISSLEVDIYLKGKEVERLKEENTELKRQRDALCRKETDNA